MMRLPFRIARLVVLCAFAPAMPAATLTAGEVLAKIQAHAGGPWHGDTVDTIKAGDPNTPVTGIVTTFAATYDVLERAVAAHANLIVSHEPTFYNHLDSTKGLAKDPVYLQKLAYINAHHLVVWRFHDHWHEPTMKPDGIMLGMMSALGWKQYQQGADEIKFILPETTLKQLAADLQKRLQIRAIRVIGDQNLKIRNVAFIPGAAGAEMQIEALERPDVEVLIAGEAREWETTEYTRDAISEHKSKALILLGHVVSEEEGMNHCADWLKDFLPGIPVTFMPAHEPFWRP